MSFIYSAFLFCSLLFIPIFSSKIVLFPCHPAVGMSLCILPQLTSGIFFRCFEMNCFVCICYGDISYHTPKMDSSNLNIFAELSSLGEGNFSFLTRHLTSRARLVLPLYDFPFSANTITFTYHPLFELFFHRSYLKTTTILILSLYLFILPSFSSSFWSISSSCIVCFNCCVAKIFQDFPLS